MTTMERRVRIIRDSDAESPREWDNVGTMVCWHRRYNLGDKQEKGDPNNWRRELAEELVGGFKIDVDDVPVENIDAALDKHVCVMLPLYLYDHSGITMGVGGFSCPWDSGQVGWIYCTWERARKEWNGTDEDIQGFCEIVLRNEVKVYDHYLTGEVYGYVVEEREEPCECCQREAEWDQVDSCGGFYGDDYRTNGIKECLAPSDIDLIVEED